MNTSQPSSISLARAPGATAPLVAVAGLSARLLAQSARRAGLRVAALDIFGDRDTRQAAQWWFDIGGAALAIDPARLVDALQRVARLPGLLGWIGGSGLEPLAAQLNETPGLPAWIGNTAQAVAAVRDPRRFFTLLDTLHIAHPEIRFTPPERPSGWLYKAVDGCGGRHIEAAAAHRPPYDARRGYFQRIGAGRSLSALFIAARHQVTVLGFAEQLSRAGGQLPFVHEGSIGPIELPPRGAARVIAALQAITARTGLSGLNSFDFLLDGDTVLALEINARPSSTMALYEAAWPQAWPRGLLAQHIDACRHGILPPPAPPHAGLCVGQQVWLAPRPLVVSERFSDACLADPACRDVPLPGTLLEPGQPVCTLLVRAASASAVPRALERQRGLVLQRLENCREPDYAFIQCHS